MYKRQGYIIGFFLAAYVIGVFSTKPILAILLGSITIYIAGVSGLMIILNTSFSNAIAIGVVPFLVGDAIKSILAVGLAFKLK